ncbi:hypothetical protein D3C87_1266360 [compost metagenome]
MNKPAVESLLSEFHTWSALNERAQKRFQAQLAPHFRLLDFLRKDELALSQYLRMLLDPKGQHGQGALYLSRFVELLPEGLRPLAANDPLMLQTEFRLPTGRRLDIYLRSASGGLAIENKPWAADQEGQLKDYATYLDSQFRDGKWALIYLCNEEIGEYSLPGDTPEPLKQRTFPLTYYRLHAWLEDCALHTRALPVRLFVEAMAQFVREQINGELSLEDNPELTEMVLRTPQNLTAAFSIAQHLPQVKRQLWGDLIEHLKRELADINAEVTLDDELLDGMKHGGLYIRIHRNDRYHICWAFDKKNHMSLYCGIYAGDPANHGEAGHSKINQAMSDLFEIDGGQTPWWPWWTYNTQATMDQQFPENWEFDPNAWLRLQDLGPTGFAAGVIRMTRRIAAAFGPELLPR